jgi:hypothetical protein
VIGLTTPAASDVLAVTVFGPSCADSTLVLRIRDQRHELLYRFEAPLAVFLSAAADPTAVSDEEAAARVRELVAELVRAQPPRRVGDLPRWSAGELDDGIRFHQHLLPRSEFQRLRDRPVFHHLAGWQLGFDVAFDPGAGQVVRVLESWR